MLALIAALGLLTASSAFAAASYVFEPTLSLTGNCSKSVLDPVEDPGCPGGEHPPSGGLRGPSVTIDSYGDIYVANVVEKAGRIDVFSPKGLFITELKDEAGPQSIAVDSKGNLYVYERIAGGERQVRRFPPTVYKPEEEDINYGEPPVAIVNESTTPLFELQPASSVAVDPATDQLYVDYSQGVARFGSAEEENKLLEKEAIAGLLRSTSIAIDAKHKKIYVSDKVLLTAKSLIRVFELEPPHKELGNNTGSTTPKGEFLSGEGFLALDVDEDAGHVFVGDLAAAKKVYEFEEDGTYLATIEHSFESVPSGEIALDNGPKSPRPQKEAWLFVPSVPSPSQGHVYAFEPKEEGPPIIESTSVGDITATEATLHATINPNGLPTEYRLEYITQQQFEEEGESFANANATVAGEGTLPKGAEGIAVSAAATGLEPGTAYRFRAFAKNSKGEGEKQRTFETFETVEGPPPCGNEALRTGLSALLPDCRGYELVTPPNTNGRPPSGVGFSGVYFPTLEASPDGNRVSFLIEGGLIPGNEGAGAFNGDLYLATRGTEGWSSEVTGPSGKEAVGPQPGSTSPDQTYSFWEDTQAHAVYIRYPDGHSELVGRGSLGEDPTVNARLITEYGSHILFQTTRFGGHVPQQLEPNAPPEGTEALYDRSAEGPTHVVSLLPGNITPKAGEDAAYLGASEEGEGIAFKIGETVYLRLRNEETFEVAGPGATFAGVAKEGKRVFYLEGGNLFAFDAEADETIEFTSSGDVTPVNVASGGTRAYFVSPSVLTGEPNPAGEEAKAGKENLYLSEEGTISFVGILTERDVEGESTSAGQLGGLGLWTDALSNPAVDPSRATPSGTTLLFESRADLTGFESEGFAEVYRYDSAQNRLDCLSCSPTGTPPTSDASLQSIARSQPSLIPFSARAKIPNQSSDGRRAFFQTAEPLVVGDTDELLDVYEWEEKGVGSCEREGGCVYLISGGHSSSPDFLFAMSQSGDDVFFRTADILLPRDKETTLSIYDARVGGGEPEPKPEIECEGEGCHPATAPPVFPSPAKPTPGAEDQVGERKHCPKGKRLVKRHGKKVCVKKHKKHHHKAGAHQRGGSR